jgi:hypothetical protein
MEIEMVNDYNIYYRAWGIKSFLDPKELEAYCEVCLVATVNPVEILRSSYGKVNKKL